MSASFTLACDQGADLLFSAVYATAVPAAAWTNATDYPEDTTVVPTTSTGWVYDATAAGMSAALEPTWPLIVGETVEDGSVTWTCAGPAVVPVDLTGFTAYMSVALSTGPTSWVATVSTTTSPQGLITLGGAAGTIAVDINGETTLLWTSTVYFYDLFLISPGGISTMVFTGKIRVNPSVTVPIFA